MAEFRSLEKTRDMLQISDLMAHMSISKVRTFLLLLVIGTVAVFDPVMAQKKLRVVTTLTDLGSIAEMIGGDRVDVTSIATGFQNPHFVDPKPSYIVKLSRADIFVTVGLDLEIGWVPPLLNSARNKKINMGAPGYVDASIGVPLLQIPASVSREQGDIHIYGNPHYWLDPENGRVIAQNIHDGLVRLDPANAEVFAANLVSFNAQLDERQEEWAARSGPLRDLEIIAYHNQWPYFEQAFGLNIVDFLEPRPGIPPTPSQLAKVLGIMTDRGIRTVIISPYYKPDAAELVVRKAGGSVVTLATSTGAFPGVDSYFDVFDYNLDAMLSAVEEATR